MSGTSGPESAVGDPTEGQGARAPWAAQVDTHRVIRGRRWRVSDPRIPEVLRQRLVDELMAARRAVRAARAAPDATAERAARARVHDAKVALGERGVRWWEPAPPVEGLDERALRAARALRSAAAERDDHTLATDVAAIVSRTPREILALLRDRDAD